MLFQVLAPLTGQIVFQTEHEACIPDENTMVALKKAGYKIRKSEKEQAKESPQSLAVYK